jgi:hypothetical protein
LATLKKQLAGAPAMPELARQAFPRSFAPRAAAPSTGNIPTSKRLRGIVPVPGTPSSVEIPVEFVSDDGEPTVQTSAPSMHSLTVAYDDVETKVASTKKVPPVLKPEMFPEEGEGSNLTEVRHDALELLRAATGSGARKTMPNYPDDQDKTDKEKRAIDPNDLADPNEDVTEVEKSRRMRELLKR